MARRPPENVGNARNARFLPELRGDDLRVESVAKLGRWQRDRESHLGGAALGLLVEEHEHRLATIALTVGVATLLARRYELVQPLVREQVIADVLDRPELGV